jgi:hypothetical protein
MAVVEKRIKMKRSIFVFLVMAAASAVVTGQSPTATPGTPFNPFGPLNHDYPTPRPTVSKKALSQVPSQTQDAKTNRNSSTAISTPTPRPNNRPMPPENSAPGASGSISFGNGAQLVRQGDQVIVTYGGRRYVMSRKDAKPPPAGMMLNCRQVKHHLDTARVDDNWRYMSIWWADHCLH